MPEWSFLTNHGAVLAVIARYGGEITARELALQLGITERSVRRIIADLEVAGYLQKDRVGRSNRYQIDMEPLRREQARDTQVGELLNLLGVGADAHQRELTPN